MKLSALLSIAAVVVIAAPAIAHTSAKTGSIHLRLHTKSTDCTITNESQCGGQNWTGSTCCANSSYECRVDDNDATIQRCQKTTATSAATVAGVPIDSSEWSDSSNSEDYEYVDDFQECTAENQICKNDMSVCVFHHRYYAECKPWTLPSGALCGQNDDINKWSFAYCLEGEGCYPDGDTTDSRCSEIP